MSEIIYIFDEVLGGVRQLRASDFQAGAGAATSALQTAGNASLASIDSKAPALVGGRMPVEPLGIPGESLPDLGITASLSATASGALTGARGISMVGTAPFRYEIYVGVVPASLSATRGNLALSNERIDISVPAGDARLSIINASGTGLTTAAGLVNITRLS